MSSFICGVTMSTYIYNNRPIEVLHMSEDGELLIMYKDNGEQEYIWDYQLHPEML